MQIEQLEPKSVFRYFYEISQIPRGSGNEKAVSDYVVNFAKEHHLEYIQDDAWNVIIRKPGTCGYEDSPIVILQGHLDMVCEKNKDTVHDFEKDPLQLQIYGDFIKANGTTLGGDNGIAVAYSLAVLASNDIPHPPLEVLFTTNEEVGMNGAHAIQRGMLKGRRLLNLDSEEEGIFLVSCAGGMRASIHLPIEQEPLAQNKKAYEIQLRGLKGGHSGMEIIKQRANSNKLMGRVLSRLYDEFDICLADISGGSKDNAIPREADAIVVTDAEVSRIEAVLHEMQQAFQYEYRNTETDITLQAKSVDLPQYQFSKTTTKSAIDVLVLIPNGVLGMSLDIAGLVESSTNIGVVKVENNEIHFTSALRSSVSTKKEEIKLQIKHLAETVGARFSTTGDYPAWEYKEHSPLRDTCVRVYRELTGEEPIVTAVHAGLECGLLSEKMDDADMISMGPNMFDVHTPNERVSISSVQRVWEYLKAVLKELK